MESSERAQKWHVAMDIFNSATLKRAPRKRIASWNVEAWIEMKHFSDRTSLTSLQKMILWDMIWGEVLDNAASRGWWRCCHYHLFGTWSYKETLTQATHSNGKSLNFQQDVHLERVHVPLPCYIPFLECALQKNGWWIISTSSIDMFYPRTVSQEFLDWYGHSKRNWLGKQHGCGMIEHWHAPI